MLILSIYPGHDAAVCLLRDGQVLFNLEVERFSRNKHDYGYREDLVRFCLDRTGVSVDDIDLLTMNRWLLKPPPLREGTSLGPCEVPLTRDAARPAIEFDAEILGRRLPGLAVAHHLAHVAGAYYTSPFRDAAVLTVDGGGDNANMSIAHGRDGRIEGYEPRMGMSLGCLWTGLTLTNYRMPPLFGGLSTGPGKIMALAAYGEDDKQVYRQLSDEMAQADGLEEFVHPLKLAFNDNEDLSDTHAPRSQALARALQRLTEEHLLALLHDLHARYPSDHLCYAGGVALNCIANTRTNVAGPFHRLHVPPCPNDAGLALGMALYAHYQHAGHDFEPGFFSPYTGPVYGEDDHRAAIDRFRTEVPEGEVRRGNLDDAIDLLESGEVCCLYRGASESGPRALGHRSIIARPDQPDLRRHLNEQVKLREWYRPYAPIILAEYAADVLDPVVDHSAYMTTSATIKPEWRERMAAVCHVDATTRPQIIERHHEPYVYDLIDGLRRRTGIPAIVNTSFNKQEPIVETPLGAVDTFLRFPLRHLILEGMLLSKPA
jgi:carbamoyltransferase